MKPKLPRLLALTLSALLLLSLCAACTAEADTLRTVKVSEVTHSVFYAPQYVAIQLGYFEAEGLQIELTTGEGADKVMTSVVSGAVDIGFSGPEAAIYIYNEGKQDYAKVFAQVTCRDGSFLMARAPDPDFTWEKLRGAHLLPGRKGGVPYMALESVVKAQGLVPGVDVLFDNSVQYAAMTGAFVGGTGDYVTVFEPAASTLEAEGKAHIVAAVGEWAGEIPYTAYYALGSYLEKNGDTIQRFTNALAKAQTWVQTHSAEEIAKAIAPAFPDADVAIMAKAIANYKAIGAYAAQPAMSAESFNRLQAVMADAGELAQPAPWADLADNSFAEKAVK